MLALPLSPPLSNLIPFPVNEFVPISQLPTFPLSALIVPVNVKSPVSGSA